MLLFCKHLANTVSSCDCIHRWGRGKCCNLPRSLLPLTEAVLPGPASRWDGKADTNWLCHHSSGARGIAVHAQTDQDHSHLGKWEKLHSPPPHSPPSHSVTPSQSHTLTVSLPHSFTPHSLLVEYCPTCSHSHIIPTHPHPHFLTPSLPHSLPSHILTPSSLTPYPLTSSLPHSFTSSLVHPLTGRGCSCGDVREPNMASGCLPLRSHWLQRPPQPQGGHPHHSGCVCQIT